MDWMSSLATAIAVLRLGLICGGMWVLLRSTVRQGVYLDYQRKCFTSAGVIYLLGLMPQSLLLLLVNSKLANYMLDNGYLCWIQNLACMTAAALHSVIFLNWILSNVHRRMRNSGNNCAAKLLNHKLVGYFLVLYVTAIILWRVTFLQRGDHKSLSTDIAYKSDYSFDPQWTMSPIENPSQVVRLQLLLCESSLAENETWNFVLAAYSFLLLPFLLLQLLWKPLLQKLCQSPSQSKDPEIETNTKDEYQSQWWETEVNIQRFLSTSVVVWFHLMQPIIFALNPNQFVDFGTHLLLTICVFIPWTHSEKEYNYLQNLV